MPANDLQPIFDFSYKVCHCCSTVKLLGSTFNQKGKRMKGSLDPVSGIGNGVFILDILL